jgi:hypothetical protein
VKFLLAIMLMMCAGRASADVLTDANIPKYDSRTDCENSPPAKFKQGWVAECLGIEESGRKTLIGMDAPHLVLAFCDADTRLHSEPFPSYWHFVFCIRREHALPAFKKIDGEIGKAAAFCDTNGRNEDQFQACLGDQMEYRALIESYPDFLDNAAAIACIDDLRRRGFLAWSNAFDCKREANRK